MLQHSHFYNLSLINTKDGFESRYIKYPTQLLFAFLGSILTDSGSKACCAASNEDVCLRIDFGLRNKL
ncbi:hypothetical protein BpHYR1_049548 [Brachionus plicatilis]|uniref:Uncharacterized protein n=1 Tax=Brachionus plicatilis TaxID=10195 RepID=A0A3M7SBF9_BRAPC|nr:hypothetical protein BpHYR1_049548 [Brachionus plicatilis]